jgi:hypothetical protein
VKRTLIVLYGTRPRYRAYIALIKHRFLHEHVQCLKKNRSYDLEDVERDTKSNHIADPNPQSLEWRNPDLD